MVDRAYACGIIEAHSLVWHPKIAPRIEALRQEVSLLAGLGRARIAAELEKTRQIALATGNVVAAVRATKLKRDMIGAFD